jgi:hypothetical protein
MRRGMITVRDDDVIVNYMSEQIRGVLKGEEKYEKSVLCETAIDWRWPEKEELRVIQRTLHKKIIFPKNILKYCIFPSPTTSIPLFLNKKNCEINLPCGHETRHYTPFLSARL